MRLYVSYALNDVMATLQNKRAGFPQNESNRAEDFARGRREASEDKPGLANDLLTAKHLLGTALSRLRFAKRIVNRARTATPSTAAPAELAKSIVQMYAESARIVEALAASYGVNRSVSGSLRFFRHASHSLRTRRGCDAPRQAP